VIVTANSPYENGQRVDIEILDESERGNVYLSKKVRHVSAEGEDMENRDTELTLRISEARQDWLLRHMKTRM
jgi:hypothetical protein